MKYNININQRVLSTTNLNIIDCAILDYLIFYCNSKNEKIEKNRVDGFTWINYKSLLEDMPLLRIKRTQSITPRMRKLEEDGFIITKIIRVSGYRRLMVNTTKNIDNLFVEQIKPNRETDVRLIVKTVRPNRETVVNNNTSNNNTNNNIVEASSTPSLPAGFKKTIVNFRNLRRVESGRKPMTPRKPTEKQDLIKKSFNVIDRFKDVGYNQHGMQFLNVNNEKRNIIVRKLIINSYKVFGDELFDLIDWWFAGAGEWATYEPEQCFSLKTIEKFKNSKNKKEKGGAYKI